MCPQTFFDCGLRIWIGNELNGIDASASLESGKDGRWPGDGAMALWLHEMTLRLYPESCYARRRGHDPAALAAGQDPDTEIRTFRPDRSAW